MGRPLTSGHENALPRCTRRTTLKVTLGDGSVMRLASGDVTIDGELFLGRLAPVDALNLELTGAVEGITLRITNAGLTLGRNLINTPDVLSDTFAVLGCYFRDSVTGEEWHDEKLPGRLRVGDIDREWVQVFFESIVDATEFKGLTIASVFPDTETTAPAPAPPVTPPAPIYDDLMPGPGHFDERGPNRVVYPILDQYGWGRYELPLIM